MSPLVSAKGVPNAGCDEATEPEETDEANKHIACIKTAALFGLATADLAAAGLALDGDFFLLSDPSLSLLLDPLES